MICTVPCFPEVPGRYSPMRVSTCLYRQEVGVRTSDISRLEAETSGAHVIAAEDTALLTLGQNPPRTLPPASLTYSPHKPALSTAPSAPLLSGGYPSVDGESSVHNGVAAARQLLGPPLRTTSLSTLLQTQPPRTSSRGLPHNLLPQTPQMFQPVEKPVGTEGIPSPSQQQQQQPQQVNTLLQPVQHHTQLHQQQYEAESRTLMPLPEQQIVHHPSLEATYHHQPEIQPHPQPHPLPQPGRLIPVSRSESFPHAMPQHLMPGATGHTYESNTGLAF